MSMSLVFSDQKIPQSILKSIFLAGPSPRSHDVIDWRHDALAILEKQGFDGTIFIPIPKERFHGGQDQESWTYDDQIQWECEARQVSDKILFWIPRDIEGGMPAFTTNVEFGEDLHSGKIVYGRPTNAQKCRYLDKRIEEIHQSVFSELSTLIEHTIKSLGNGSLRQHGEVYVPLFIWETEQFQNWYQQLQKNGNRLDGSKLIHHFKTKSGNLITFTLHVNVWVEKEQRNKSNEFVFVRKDISSVVPFYVDEEGQKHIVLVKEFRSAVNNASGFIYELPSGSSNNPLENPLENACHELEEETGIHIEDLKRFHFICKRQIAGTLSSYKASTYAVQLTKDEFLKVLQSIHRNETYGLKEHGEITYLEVITLDNLINSPVDYSTIGIIISAFYFMKNI